MAVPVCTLEIRGITETYLIPGAAFRWQMLFTHCLNHSFFLIKSLKKNSNGKDWVLFLSCQLYLVITAFLSLISQSKTLSDPSTVITAKAYVQQGEESRSEAS